jgi:hypothetical protein
VTIIPLALSNTSLSSSQAAETFFLAPESRPWAPFRTLADFEYTETAVKGLLSKDLVDKQLAGFNEKWTIGGSHLTLCTYKDMQDSLTFAREYGVQVRCSMISLPPESYAENLVSLNQTKCLQLIVGSS